MEIINQTIIDNVKAHGVFTWQTQRSLPGWFTLAQKQAISKIDAEETLMLIKARNEGFITLDIELALEPIWNKREDSWYPDQLATIDALSDFWNNNKTSIQREILHELKLHSEENYLSQLTTQLPRLPTISMSAEEHLMIIDPGSRSGMKLLAADALGAEISHSIIFPHEPQNQWQQGQRKFGQFIQTSRVKHIAIIEGEGFKESRRFLMEWLSTQEHAYPVYHISEAGLDVLCDWYVDESQDNLHLRARQAARLALSPQACFETIPLQCLLKNPLKTTINPWHLEQSLRARWLDKSEGNVTYKSDPLYSNPVTTLDDLSVGQELAGRIINTTDFGYFIDVGIEQNGLLHKSQLKKSSDYSLNDIIKVYVEKVLIDKSQFSLSTRKAQPKRPNKPRKQTANANSAMADALQAALKKQS